MLPNSKQVDSTARIEAFSDGVIAVIITLLILEVRVPNLDDTSTRSVLEALVDIAPKLISFAVSFFTVAIFWVQHHHFFATIARADWKLLWYNNFTLFWVCIVPFTTAFVGDYPTQPLVVSLYAAEWCMIGLSFLFMSYYVLFKSDLLSVEVAGLEERQRHWNRSWISVSFYALAAVLAFVSVNGALGLLALIPLLFVVPNLLRQE